MNRNRSWANRLIDTSHYGTVSASDETHDEGTKQVEVLRVE